MAVAAVTAALTAGLAVGQGKPKLTDEEKARLELEARLKLKKVRREVKQLDYDETMARVPQLIARETEYLALVEQMQEAATGGKGDITEMLKKGRSMKIAALKDLNEILKLHRGKHAGIEEKLVRERLAQTRLDAVNYEEEWLVNILDDLEEAMQVNLELDARVYKFDVVSFDFPKTTAKAMLQTMADALLFKWAIRGDTLYVYKERHEVLFDADWLAQKRAAWKARKKAREAAARAAEKRAAEGTSAEGEGE
jgi:hypothetical protein